MACKRAATAMTVQNQAETMIPEAENEEFVSKMMFGVDSAFPANDHLQNNLSLFEWASRNKLYPNFWGRNINGENALTVEEINYIHKNGCKVVLIYLDSGEKETEARGENIALAIAERAMELGITDGTAVFLKIDSEENATTDFLRGFADGMLDQGLIPGFMADTDSVSTFDREYSRGLNTDRELFEKCLIWAVSPSLAEFNRVTDTHTISPDEWKPYAPSAITRNEISVWQYGKNCHPVHDDDGKEIVFNINLTRGTKFLKTTT